MTFSLTWPDYVVLGIILLSVVISLVRGFVREAVSVATWIVAVWVAFKFSSQLSDLFTNLISTPAVRGIVAFAVVMVSIVIVGAIINYLISLLVKKSGLSGTDRLLGIIFGGLRGVVVVGALVLIGNLTALGQTTAWQKAKIVPYFDGLADWMSEYIPKQFKKMEETSQDAFSSSVDRTEGKVDEKSLEPETP